MAESMKDDGARSHLLDAARSYDTRADMLEPAPRRPPEMP